jgi:hypothetical protein
MACRAGITTRPDERKREWERKEPTLRNWQLFGPFASRSAAQKWEEQQPCTKHGGGNEPDTPGARWYGYRFDY